MMSTHQRSEFPPQWEPPPRVGYGEQTPALVDVLEAMTQTPTAEWVRQAYLSSFERRYLQEDSLPMDVEDWPRASRLLDTVPEGKALHEKYEKRIGRNDEYIRHSTEPTTPGP